MKTLPAAPPAGREDRAATQLLHDEANLRVVAFHLLPGQTVHPHRSTSSVFVQVVSGRGTFTGETDAAVLGAGEAAVYAPGELHGMTAAEEPLHFLAVITPRPQ